jgi:hypothetical protein
MMQRIAWLGSVLVLALAAVACGDDNAVLPAERIELRYDFSEGALGWEAGFSDYGPEFEMELDSGIAPLPASLTQEGQGFRITGFNRTDDLFMFLKRGIGTAEGVEPGQSYQVSYRIVFASDAPTGCFGVGGPPGEAVWLKAGVVAVEPDVELIDNYWHLTVDKDNQSSGGEDVWLVGDIANGIECEEAIEADYPYAEVEREYTHDEMVTATDEGEFWLIVGTDSGFEGRTELFYLAIEVRLEPVGS